MKYTQNHLGYHFSFPTKTKSIEKNERQYSRVFKAKRK